MHADSGAAPDPARAAQAFNAGNAAYRAGRWQDALDHYEAALALDAAMASAALQHARCLVQLQQWLPAREAFAATLRMASPPDAGNHSGHQAIHYSAWLEAGHLCRQTGQEQQALQAYQCAMQLAPQRHEAPLALARVLEAGGQWAPQPARMNRPCSVLPHWVQTGCARYTSTWRVTAWSRATPHAPCSRCRPH